MPGSKPIVRMNKDGVVVTEGDPSHIAASEHLSMSNGHLVVSSNTLVLGGVHLTSEKLTALLALVE